MTENPKIVPLHERHVDADLLRRIIAGDSDRNERVDALVHLGGDCPVCHGELQKLAESDADIPVKEDHPVAMALARRVRDVDVPASVRPIHWHWIQRVREDGWAICRLVLEETRHQIFQCKEENKAPLYVVTDDVLETFIDPAFYAIGEARWNDLQSLAYAYYGGAFTRWGETERLRRDQRGRVGLHGTAASEDLEVAIRRMMSHFEFSCRGSWWKFPLASLQAVFDNATACHNLTGHLAEHLRFKAHFLGRGYGGQTPEAMLCHAAALRHAPQDCLKWRKIVVLHVLADAMNSSHYDCARNHLDEARRLTAAHGSDEDRALILRVQGTLDLWAGREGAESLMLEACDAYLKIHKMDPTLAMIAVLAEHYGREGRREDVVALQNLFRRAVLDPAATPAASEHVGRIRQAAEQLGIEDVDVIIRKINDMTSASRSGNEEIS